MTNMPTPPHAFSAMMRSLVDSLGQYDFDTSTSHGFEFESDGHVVRCFPHPTDESRFVIECDVTTLGDDLMGDPALMRLLHQINEAAWLECGWTAMLNVDGLCFIGQTMAVVDATPQRLQELIVDSIERASALVQIIGALVRGLPTESNPDLRLFTQRA
jgi:hypothetical protein